MVGIDIKELERAETELEEWLAAKAKAGLPELVLVGLLRDYADDIEHIGHVPRRWAASDPGDEQ